MSTFIPIPRSEKDIKQEPTFSIKELLEELGLRVRSHQEGGHLGIMEDGCKDVFRVSHDVDHLQKRNL